jgi:hypothetical protein
MGRGKAHKKHNHQKLPLSVQLGHERDFHLETVAAALTALTATNLYEAREAPIKINENTRTNHGGKYKTSKHTV